MPSSHHLLICSRFPLNYFRSHCLQISVPTASQVQSVSTPIRNSKKPPAAVGTDSKALPPVTTVVFVGKQNAKLVKTELEKLSFLDKRFRMTPVTSTAIPSSSDNAAGKEIAVPITNECMNVLASANASNSTDEHLLSWVALVEGTGKQEMPFSTSQFARKRKEKQYVP